ncbi:MAG TPA: glucose 1-dehydrogenase [Caulobacteraceae bacterium]|jgi:3-oxoacyl-[acyl-carrier protein] reductase|nr:glucose 1-dehydrogenase [Caulobacteraceae bacterium]
MALQGKTAIVTGGASGFGEGIVRRFAAEGAQVVIADLNFDAAVALAKEIGGGAIAAGTDVSDDADVGALAALLGKRRIDILVNNAGIGHLPQPLDKLSEAEFDRVWAVNVKSVYLTARHFVPAMKAAKSGAILNIASTGGVSPRPNLTWYNASKGWMISATRAMAIELARYGIRVNAINPVAGDTPLLATFMGGSDTPEGRERILTTIPLGRLSTPFDIAAAAAFLCSDDAAMITGVALEVDGGRCL